MKKSSARCPPLPPSCCDRCAAAETEAPPPSDRVCCVQRSCCVNLQRTCTCVSQEATQKRKSKVGLLGTIKKKLSSSPGFRQSRNCQSSPCSPGHCYSRNCCSKTLRSRSAERPRSTAHKEIGCKSATLRKKVTVRRRSRDYENDSTDSESEVEGATGGTAKVLSPPTDGYGHATALVPRRPATASAVEPPDDQVSSSF